MNHLDPEEAKEILLDHYRNPRNYGRVDNATSAITENNPVCGDTVHITVKVESGVIRETKFVGQGCSISQASASILTEYAVNKRVDEMLNLSDTEYVEMIGFPLGPNREKCALLSLNALKKALRNSGSADR